MIQRKILKTAPCRLLSPARFASVYGLKALMLPNFFTNRIWVFFKADFYAKNTHVFSKYSKY